MTLSPNDTTSIGAKRTTRTAPTYPEQSVLERLKEVMGDVPCNGCTACCRNNHLIILFPEHGDDVNAYDTYQCGEHRDGSPVYGLKFKDNGDCIYLDDNGCSIHDRAPSVCRFFDCRGTFLSSTRTERRQMMKDGHESAEVYRAGRDRIGTLSEEAKALAADMRHAQVGGGTLAISRARRGGR